MKVVVLLFVFSSLFRSPLVLLHYSLLLLPLLKADELHTSFLRHVSTEKEAKAPFDLPRPPPQVSSSCLSFFLSFSSFRFRGRERERERDRRCVTREEVRERGQESTRKGGGRM